MKNKNVRYVAKGSENFLYKRMVDEKADGYVKKGTFSNEIVWGNNSYIIPCMSKRKNISFKKGMFLFGMVRKDVKNFLKDNPKIKLPAKHSQIEYSQNFNEELLGKITATDLNHAYWRIAYNLGVIREATYNKGLPDMFKQVRLAALSTLGASKKYQKIKGGEPTNEYLVIKGDEELQKVYVYIRYTCYRYMDKVKKMLGNDFVCYKTDCMYYLDSSENRKMVRNFFEKENLLIKQLV